MDSEQFYNEYYNIQENENKSVRHKRSLRYGFSNKKDSLGRYYSISRLPKIHDIKYEAIKFLSYNNYRNSIAYEMLIRTNEYIEAKNSIISKEEKEERFDKLGLSYYEDLKYSKIYIRKGFEVNLDLNIDIIKNGLKKLIEFYIKDKNIYKRKSDENIEFYKYTDKGYKRDVFATYEKVYSSLESYYIPSYSETKVRKEFIRLSDDINLIKLERSFLTYIKEYLPNDLPENIYFAYNRPKLRFKELVNVNVNIDLNLPKKELIKMINSLKDSYDDGSLKSPMNILYNEEYELQDLKDIIPFRFSRKNIARAFFIYDLYKAIDKMFKVDREYIITKYNNEIKSLEEEIEEEIKKLITNNKNEIENLPPSLTPRNKEQSIKAYNIDLKNKKNKLKEKKESKKKEIKNEYKEEYSKFDTMNKLCELFESSDNSSMAISENTIKKYLSFMQEYIDGKKYKELIIGKKISK